jgi:hypothetical protein
MTRVSTYSDLGWLDLLRTAKTIRRSVRPVKPSPGFRRHLRSDLKIALGTGQAAPWMSPARRNVSPAVVLGACLGLAAIALALTALRNTPSQPQGQ